MGCVAPARNDQIESKRSKKNQQTVRAVLQRRRQAHTRLGQGSRQHAGAGDAIPDPLLAQHRPRGARGDTPQRCRRRRLDLRRVPSPLSREFAQRDGSQMAIEYLISQRKRSAAARAPTTSLLSFCRFLALSSRARPGSRSCSRMRFVFFYVCNVLQWFGLLLQ